MSWIDIGIIALVVLCGLIGVLRGAKKSLLALGAFVVSLLLAFFLSNVVAEAFLGIDAIKNFVVGNGAFESEFSLANWIYKGLGENTAGIPEDAYLYQHFFAPVQEIIGASTVTFDPVQGRAIYLAFMLFSALCGVGIFFVARFLLMIVTAIVKSYIGKKKSIGSRLLGFGVSFVQGGIAAFAVTLVFTCFGGLAFVPGFGKIENEFEHGNAVFCNHLYTGAYAVRNKLFLPDTEMYGRLIGIVTGGEEIPDPDTEKLAGNRLELFVDINNLNYKNDPWSVDPETKKRVFDGNIAEAIVADDYKSVGFDGIMQAILDYNAQTAGIIDDTSKLAEIADSEFATLCNLVRTNDVNYSIQNSIDKLIGYLNIYIANYDAGALLTDPEKITQWNTNVLSNDYKNISDTIDELITRFAPFETLFGEYPDLESQMPERVSAGPRQPDQSGDGSGTTTPPDQSGDGSGTTTPPDQSGDGSGTTTPPDQSGDGSGTATPPDQSDDGSGTTTPPDQSGDGSGTTTPPDQGDGGNE